MASKLNNNLGFVSWVGNLMLSTKFRVIVRKLILSSINISCHIVWDLPKWKYTGIKIYKTGQVFKKNLHLVLTEFIPSLLNDMQERLIMIT